MSMFGGGGEVSIPGAGGDKTPDLAMEGWHVGHVC